MPAVGILGWKRSKYQRPILHNSKNIETPRKLFLELIKNTGESINQRGRPLPRRPPGRPPVPIFCYMKSFTLEKIISKLSGRNTAAMRRNLGRTNLGLQRSCSAGETSLREGGNHHHRHHHRSSHREGVNLHQHLHQHHLISNPSSSLVSNLCIQTSDWYLWVASSVDYSLQLMLVGLFGGRSYVQILYAY